MAVKRKCYGKLCAGDYVIVNADKVEAAKIGVSYYVAKIVGFQKKKNKVLVEVNWYFWPMETPFKNRKFIGGKELFESLIIQTVDVGAILRKCRVLKLKDYTKLRPIDDDDFYCRFRYTELGYLELVGGGKIDDIPVFCTCEEIYNPDKAMVFCEQCEDWFHLDCIGLCQKEVTKLSSYICDICQSKGVVKRPRISLKESFNKAMAPLSEEQRQEVLNVFSRPRSEIVVSGTDIEITGKNFRCLKPHMMLNDEIVNSYFELLKQRQERHPDNYPKCSFLSSFLYTKLLKSGHEKVKSWTKRYNISNSDKIFVPIHLESQLHWSMVVIDKVKQKLMYIDSLGGSGSGIGIMRTVAQYYKNQVKHETGKDIDIDGEWELVEEEDNPKQKNTYDCGLFMIKCADFMSRGLPPLFCQKDMSFIRNKTAYEILKLWVD